MRTIDRTGGTFLHTSRTNPASVREKDMPEHLKSPDITYPHDLTPVILKNLEDIGIDALIPIGGDDTLSFAAHLNKERFPQIATMERVVQKRGARVYVDTGQTGTTRAIVAPYSVRAVAGATVSTPLEWDEVGGDLDPLILFLPLHRLAAHLPPQVQVYAKAEWFNPGGSIKDRPALNILRGALADGLLSPGKRLLDSTSGNMGIAYATFGAALGVPVTLTLPGNASPERVTILRALGAELILTDPLEGSDGAIRLARQLAAEQPERYSAASPMALLPLGVNQLILHGTADEALENIWNQRWWNDSERASWKLNGIAARVATGMHPEAILASALSVGPRSAGLLGIQHGLCLIRADYDGLRQHGRCRNLTEQPDMGNVLPG